MVAELQRAEEWRNVDRELAQSAQPELRELANEIGDGGAR